MDNSKMRQSSSSHSLPTEEQLLSLDESNLRINIIRQFQLLFSLRESNYIEEHSYEWKLLSLLENVFKSRSSSQVFFYMCKHKCATAWVLQVELGISEPSIYRALKNLSAQGFIHKVRKLPKFARFGVKGGQHPTVWGIPDLNREDVAECINVHNRAMSPKYRLAEEIAQGIIQDFLKPWKRDSIDKKDVANTVRRIESPYHVKDLIELTIISLRDKKIKVWA